MMGLDLSGLVLPGFVYFGMVRFAEASCDLV